MAIKCAEAYTNGNVVAVKTNSGGYNYYIAVETKVGFGGRMDRLDSFPAVNSEISKLTLEILDLKMENTTP